MSRFGLIALLPLCLLGACAEGSGGVTRMADGVRYEGRFINPEAYAAYLLGVEREARGEYVNALSAYHEAHAEDPDSPEIWARIGAVRCAMSAPERGVSSARAAFQRGLENDPKYFGNYLERARCAERGRDLQASLTDATAAVRERPRDEPSNLLVARVLQSLGRPAEARAWLEAFQSYQGTSPTLAHALEAARDQANGTTRRSPNGALEGPFDALRSGRVVRAHEQAQIEMEADPSNSNAWIAALVACDELHDEACFEHALGRLESPSLAPSATALIYLRELLARRAGAQLLF